VVTLGYNLSPADKIFINGSADIGAPKDFAQGYRRNTAVMYYSLDNNFLTYFGSNGIVEVDKAYAILNALPKVSQMSPDLSEYPLQAQRLNPTAEALSLYDLKSQVLALMVEQLGLAEPERYIWAMHDRYLPSGGACPADEEYLIVKRNFDPVTYLPSSYVNGTLYTYVIDELCDATPPPAWRALCYPVAVDQDAPTFTAVADNSVLWCQFYTGLTRDDVGGIRYLLRSNNVASEFAPTNSLVIQTNTTQAVELVTSNLTLFAQQALQTNAASLAAIYPGLVIISSTNYPVLVWTTNLTFLYLTNSPYDAAGTPPYIPIFATNVVPTVQLQYQHTFGNLVTFSNTPNGWVTLPVTTLTPFMGHALVTLQTTITSTSPYGTGGTNDVFTNTVSHTFVTNEVVGDFAILPTNSCGLQVAFPLLTNVFATTNLLTSTNALAALTNSATAQFSQSLVQYFTNHIYWAYNVDCLSNTTALRQGIEKITYVRRDFDSLLSRFFVPVTNEYTMMVVSNGLATPEVIHRVVTIPDFLFTAQDMNAGPAGIPVTPVDARNIQFSQSPDYPGQAGPGTIDPFTVFTFNNATPVFANIGGNTGSEASQFVAMIWGSFDMTTNPPIVYPSSLSLSDLENMLLIQITPASLPGGWVNQPYSAQFQTQASTPNWQTPITWSLDPNSAGLPPGLALSSAGLISGTPTQSGTYYFVVVATDAASRTINRAYSIQVQ
jgi:hypothetical protein